MGKTAWVLLAVLSTSYCCDAYKILVIFPLPGKSHNILGTAVVKHLLNAGHEVTFITSIINKKPHANLTQIDVTSNWGMIPDDIFNLKNALDGKFDVTSQWFLFLTFHMLAKATLENFNVQTLLADQGVEFDLVIAEWMFNEMYSGLAPLYNAPLVWFSTVEPHGLILSVVDEYVNPSYNTFFIDSIPPFSFTERVRELWETAKVFIFRHTAIELMQYWHYNNLIAPHFKSRGRVAPSFEEAKYNGSLVLGNSHVSLGQSTRLPQIYKAIAGYHISEEVQPLPEDIKKIMDSSKNGVIYFSMGSNLKSRDLPDELKRDILEVFGSLKQNVFWKLEEELPNTPKNVHILKWAPQQSILAHPNTVLFITHGGFLSTTETIHAGVPVVGVPVFADQFSNVNRAVRKGFAKRVDLTYSMGKHLKEVINDVLTDPKYTQTAKRLSVIYHDRPVKPAAEMLHWIEHVVKTKGAPHLRSIALETSWYQKLYLDLIIVLAIVIYGLRRISKVVLPIIFPKRYTVKKQKKQ